MRTESPHYVRPNQLISQQKLNCFKATPVLTFLEGGSCLKKYYRLFLFTLVIVGSLAFSQAGYCSVESSLSAIQNKLVNQILPLAGVLGLCFAGFSFFTGNPGARSHLVMAIIGAAVSFGASSIIEFVRALVH